MHTAHFHIIIFPEIAVTAALQSHRLIKTESLGILEVDSKLETALIGEFKGKNAVYRVLPDGKMEVTGQGTGKLLGMDAFVASTSIGTMQNGVFSGEVYASITTMDGQTVFCKANAIGYPSGNGGVSRAASVQTTQSEKLARLTKVVLLQEFETDMTDNWTGKIWEWK
jgi:hypothetical protein